MQCVYVVPAALEDALAQRLRIRELSCAVHLEGALESFRQFLVHELDMRFPGKRAVSLPSAG